VISRQPNKSVWLDLDGAILMLEKGRGGAGTHVLALRIAREERAAWANKLPIAKSTAYTIYTHDPDGNLVGLSHYPDAAS
jgi:glyoxylase I family protein